MQNASPAAIPRPGSALLNPFLRKKTIKLAFSILRMFALTFSALVLSVPFSSKLAYAQSLDFAEAELEIMSFTGATVNTSTPEGVNWSLLIYGNGNTYFYPQPMTADACLNLAKNLRPFQNYFRGRRTPKYYYLIPVACMHSTTGKAVYFTPPVED